MAALAPSPPSNTTADAVLLRALRNGDETAFVSLYREHQGPVFRYAAQMCGRPEVADEVVQETFLVLLRSTDLFDPAKGSLRAWLLGVARRQVLRLLERERRWVALEREDEGSDDLPASDQDVLTALASRQRIDLLREAVSSLPPHYREVVILCELEEMPYEEAAGLVGCPVGTVRSRLHRAKGMLVAKLRQREGLGR